MSNWREQILSEFTPTVARPHSGRRPRPVVFLEGILTGIRELGFELIPFDVPIGFRYAYESRFRSRWEQDEQPDLVVALDSEARDLN